MFSFFQQVQLLFQFRPYFHVDLIFLSQQPFFTVRYQKNILGNVFGYTGIHLFNLSGHHVTRKIDFSFKQCMMTSAKFINHFRKSPLFFLSLKWPQNISIYIEIPCLVQKSQEKSILLQSNKRFINFQSFESLSTLSFRYSVKL